MGQTNKPKKREELLLRDFVLSRHIKMFPSAVQKKTPAWRRKESKVVCVSQIIAGMAPRRCDPPSTAARADRSLRLFLMASVRKQETAAVFILFIYFFCGEGTEEDYVHRRSC